MLGTLVDMIQVGAELVGVVVVAAGLAVLVTRDTYDVGRPHQPTRETAPRLSQHQRPTQS
jgi:hypothetical protein